MGFALTPYSDVASVVFYNAMTGGCMIRLLSNMHDLWRRIFHQTPPSPLKGEAFQLSSTKADNSSIFSRKPDEAEASGSIGRPTKGLIPHSSIKQLSELSMTGAGHRPEIDGLRAIAVIGVVLFHAKFAVAPGGFVGVDVFFFLSGFLIATQLIRTDSGHQVDLIGFYERRFRRIFPAIVPCLAVTWLGALLLLSQSQFADFAKSVAASALFGANLYFWSSAGYFDGQSDLKPLLHMWSLGVEVQYYIGYSLVIAAVVFLKKPAVLVTVAIAAASLISAIWLMHIGHRDSAFYLPYARFWELLAGSTLALLPRLKMRQLTADIVEIIGAALILFPMLIYNDSTPFPGISAIPAVLGTAIIVAAENRGRVIAAVLRLSVMQHLGAVSYSLYLWHLPLIVFARFISPEPSALITVVTLILAYIIAIASHRFVETPFRNRNIFTRRRIAISYVGAISFVIALTAVSLDRHFEARRFNALTVARTYLLGPERQEAIAALDAAETDYQAHLNNNFTGSSGAFDAVKYAGWTCSYDEGNALDKLEACLLGQAKQENVIVIGDSNGRDNFHALEAAYPAINFIMIHQGSCPPADFYIEPATRCFADYGKLLDKIAETSSIDGIVLAFRYRPTEWENVETGIIEAQKFTKHVALVGPTPFFLQKIPQYILTLPPAAPLPEVINRSNTEMFGWQISELNTEAFQMAAKHGIAFLAVQDAICDRTSCALWDGSHDHPIFWDANHFTRFGIEKLTDFYRATSLFALSSAASREIGHLR